MKDFSRTLFALRLFLLGAGQIEHVADFLSTISDSCCDSIARMRSNFGIPALYSFIIRSRMSRPLSPEDDFHVGLDTASMMRLPCPARRTLRFR